MKNPKFVLSHLAIFALGVAVALISAKDPKNGNSGAGPSGKGSDGLGSASSGSAGRDATEGRRSRRDSDSSRASARSPHETLGKINGLPDTYERQRALMDFFDKLGPDQFADVADEFQKLYHFDNSGTEMQLLFQAWAKADPTAALDYIDLHPDTQRNHGEVLETWAGKDPAAAEQWAVDKHVGEGANPYLASVIKGIAAFDLPYASRLTQSMPMSNERGQAIDAMAKALLMKGTEEAFAFPDTIEDEHLK